MTSTTFTVASVFALEVSFILLVILILRIRKLKRLLSDCKNESTTGVQTQQDKKIKKTAKQDSVEEEIANDSMDSQKEQIYIARIKNLEIFKDMYIAKLEGSHKLFTKIDDLKKIAESDPAPDLSYLQNKINELELEKNQLKESLNTLRDTLDSQIKETESFEHEQQQKLAEITEENEFLVVQIQHLLKQEVETTNDLMMKIKTLEDALAAASA